MNTEIKPTKIIGCSKSHSKREVHSDKYLYQETRKISNNHSQGTGKRTNEAQSYQKEGNNRLEKIDDIKNWFFEQIKLTDFQLDSPSKKEKGLK